MDTITQMAYFAARRLQIAKFMRQAAPLRTSAAVLDDFIRLATHSEGQELLLRFAHRRH